MPRATLLTGLATASLPIASTTPRSYEPHFRLVPKFVEDR
jgi:hypothetical protein